MVCSPRVSSVGLVAAPMRAKFLRVAAVTPPVASPGVTGSPESQQKYKGGEGGYGGKDVCELRAEVGGDEELRSSKNDAGDEDGGARCR